jgi:hypothetical protein|nr:MAG TPA: hypothetical protein [Caudoviricetes sp.]
MSNKRFIYNVQQARYFIQLGGIVIDTGVHAKTNKPFWVFDFDETRELMKMWCNRNDG